MIRLLYNPNEEGIATRITVPVSDVLKLTEENEEFREMFLRVAGQLEPKKTPSQMARTMKESYKSYWRKKIAKKQPLVLSDEENDDEEECDDQSGSKKIENHYDIVKHLHFAVFCKKRKNIKRE